MPVPHANAHDRPPTTQTAEGNRGRELLCLELSAVRLLAPGAGARGRPRARWSAPQPQIPLGVYFHIPFCRKRCHFCYFRVYTDKNSQEIRRYLRAGMKEFSMFVKRRYLEGRKPRFVYFGGGTPSYLSVPQLEELTRHMKDLMPWDEIEEVTFECEPGTLTEKKLDAIRAMGVTRLSLGVENFDDHILEINGRAHRSQEIARAYGHARASDSLRSTSTSSPGWSRKPRRTGNGASTRRSKCSPTA